MAQSPQQTDQREDVIIELVKVVSDKERSELREIISNSRVSIILGHMFLGFLTINMETDFSYAIPTAGTDGDTIIWNPTFLKMLNENQLYGVTVHEVLHAALDHPRRGMFKEDHMRWNIVIDVIVNQYIAASNESLDQAHQQEKLELPLTADGKQGTISWDNFKWKVPMDSHKVINSTAEELYNLIDDDCVEQLEKMCGGKGKYWCDISKSMPGKQGDAEEWVGRMIHARDETNQAGKLPGGIDEAVENLRNPQKNWLDELRDFVIDTEEDWGFYPPDRRYAESDFIMPDVNYEAKLSNIVLMVDTSGSISHEDLCDFVSETYHIARLSQQVILCYIDADVQGWHEMESGDVPPAPKGRGGTDFRPGFKKLNEEIQNGLCVSGVVFFTDGYPCEWPKENCTDVPVLWVINTDVKAPWGRCIKYQPKQRF